MELPYEAAQVCEGTHTRSVRTGIEHRALCIGGILERMVRGFDRLGMPGLGAKRLAARNIAATGTPAPTIRGSANQPVIAQCSRGWHAGFRDRARRERERA